MPTTRIMPGGTVPMPKPNPEVARQRARSCLIQSVIEGATLIALIEWIFLSSLPWALLIGLTLGGALGWTWHVLRTDAGVSALIAVLVVLARLIASSGPFALASPMTAIPLVLCAALAHFMAQQRQKERMGI